MATSRDDHIRDTEQARDPRATTHEGGEHVREDAVRDDGYADGRTDRLGDRHDRDHDGRDDRLEGGAAVGDRHDRDHDGRDDRLEGGAAVGGRHDRDHDGRDDRLEGDHGTHDDRRDDRHDHRGRDAAVGAAGGAAAGAAVAHERDKHRERREERVLREERPVRDAAVLDHEVARERFGGINWGAAFFGWLVAVGMTALLTGILAVAATAIGYSNGITVTDAQRDAGTVTAVTAAVLLAVLLVAYYSGGYVAGRMSRFDGGKQGLGAWVVGLLITLVAAVLGWVGGDQYNLLDRVNVPRIPIPTQDVTIAGIAVAVLVLLVTLFAAMLGGKVGRRYHARVDRHALVDTTTY